MKKVIKKGVILVGISAMLIGLIGCTNNKTSNPNNDEESEVSVESTEELPIATIKVKNFGTIKAELYPDKAPNTVNNFISLVKSGFYDNNTFHRLHRGFVLQGGDPTGTGGGDPGYSIKGEFMTNGVVNNTLKHEKGVLSMARANDPDSAGSQFFIMLGTADHLDGSYAAFGKVIKGMDVVEAIEKNEAVNGDSLVKKLSLKKALYDLNGYEYVEPIIIENK